MIPAHQLCGCFSRYFCCCDSDNPWLAICGFVALADSRDSNPFYGFYSPQGQYCPATCRHREQNSSEKLTAEIITSRPVFIAQKAAPSDFNLQAANWKCYPRRSSYQPSLTGPPKETYNTHRLQPPQRAFFISNLWNYRSIRGGVHEGIA